MQVRPKQESDHIAIIEIANALPQWFTSGGIESIKTDLHFQPGFVAVNSGNIVGFLTYFVNQGKANIGWIGVLPQKHRSGIGAMLLEGLKRFALEYQIKTILVSTLGDSVEYEPYARTRSFYRKNGFQDFQKIQHPENPECEEELILGLEINGALQKE